MAESTDTPLSPAQRSKIRRLAAPHEPQPGEEAGELNIVPYLDIIMNIIVFVISTLTVVFLSTIDAQPPNIGSGARKTPSVTKSLSLTAIISSDGISLKTSAGNLATGCNTFGAGVTVPKVNSQNDYAELTRCARELKNKFPNANEETQVTITANPDVDYQTVVATLDALRKDKDGDLFPDPAFGVAR